MKKITLSFQVIAAIIAVTILQVCAGTAAASTCEMPTLSPSTKTGAGSSVSVLIKTATPGAHLELKVDSSDVSLTINAQSKTVTIYVPKWGTTVIYVKATLSGWTDSAAAKGTYTY